MARKTRPAAAAYNRTVVLASNRRQRLIRLQERLQMPLRMLLKLLLSRQLSM
jgi:hypothetical protein